MTALCQCGCGLPTLIARRTNTAMGWVKGEPRRYRKGHNMRTKPYRWLAEDRGYLTPCWIWQCTTAWNGYGRAWDGTRVSGAHRVVYEETKGSIPKGMDLDHLCRVRACVNPDHLEPVTRGENLRRGYAARRMEATQ